MNNIVMAQEVCLSPGVQSHASHTQEHTVKHDIRSYEVTYLSPGSKSHETYTQD